MAKAGKLRWGILGPGAIARAFADGLVHSPTGELVAIGTRNPDRPGLATEFPEARIELEDSLQALDIALTPEQVRWLEAG
jgi:predicted dehydrogenase